MVEVAGLVIWQDSWNGRAGQGLEVPLAETHSHLLDVQQAVYVLISLLTLVVPFLDLSAEQVLPLSAPTGVRCTSPTPVMR